MDPSFICRWIAQIRAIESADCEVFRKYLTETPYTVAFQESDFAASRAIFASACKQANQHSEIDSTFGDSLIRSAVELEGLGVLAHAAFVRNLLCADITESVKIQVLASEYTEVRIEIREKTITISSRATKTNVVTYPILATLDHSDLCFQLFPSEGARLEDYIVHGLKLSLKLLLLHPFLDCNGRMARALLTLNLVKGLQLEFVPWLSPFWRLRNGHISYYIEEFMQTGHIGPYFFSVSSAIRDTLEAA